MTGGNMGKPTTYNGITFRSRLEARWAAMFDVLGWTWEYEPESRAAYIPDFVLHGINGRKCFVEVKPLVTYLSDPMAIVKKALPTIGGDPFIVLTGQFSRAIGFDVQILGFIFDPENGFDNAVLFNPGAKSHGLEFDFAGEFGSWAGTLTGAYDGNALFESSLVGNREFFQFWSRAGNAIQWMPSR